MGLRRASALVVLGALALVPVALGQDGVQVSGSLAYDGESRNRLVLSFTTGGSASTGRLQLILKQPSGPMTVSASSPAASCSTFMAGDTPGANCDYAGGLAPGTTGTLTLDLPGAYPENGGAELRAYASGGGAAGNPVDVAGPTRAEPSRAADLAIEVSLRRFPGDVVVGDDIDDPGPVDDMVRATVVTKVTNNGPDAAENLVVRLDAPTLPSASDEQWRVYHSCPPGSQRSQGVLTPATIECGALAPGASTFLYSIYGVIGTGPFAQRGTATSPTTDPGPGANEDLAERAFGSLPDSQRAAAKRRLLEGRARAASAVDVAVRPQSSGGRSAAAGCRWLARASGSRFVADPGACDAPRWLKADGSRRWKLSLPRVRAGRYVAYVRARKGALAEATFSARDGNRVTFRVR